MKRVLSLLGMGIVAGSVSAEEIDWQAAVPLWKKLSTNGHVIEAGPAPLWMGPKPAEPFARLGLPARPAPEGKPRPQELPEILTVNEGPTLPAVPSAKAVRATEQPKSYGREAFAIGTVSGKQ